MYSSSESISATRLVLHSVYDITRMLSKLQFYASTCFGTLIHRINNRCDRVAIDAICDDFAARIPTCKRHKNSEFFHKGICNIGLPALKGILEDRRDIVTKVVSLGQKWRATSILASLTTVSKAAGVLSSQSNSFVTDFLLP